MVTKEQDTNSKMPQSCIFSSGPRVTLVIRQAKFVFSSLPVF